MIKTEKPTKRLGKFTAVDGLDLVVHLLSGRNSAPTFNGAIKEKIPAAGRRRRRTRRHMGEMD